MVDSFVVVIIVVEQLTELVVEPAVAVATVVEENPDEFIAHAQYSSEQTGVDSYVAQATASEVQKTNSAPSEPPTVHMTNL